MRHPSVMVGVGAAAALLAAMSAHADPPPRKIVRSPSLVGHTNQDSGLPPPLGAHTNQDGGPGGAPVVIDREIPVGGIGTIEDADAAPIGLLLGSHAPDPLAATDLRSPRRGLGASAPIPAPPSIAPLLALLAGSGRRRRR